MNLEWTRRDRVDGDPFWSATLHDLHVAVRVPHAEWCFEWSICSDDEGGLAEGYVMIDPVEDERWNYQNVELAQRRCERVAWVIWCEMQADARTAMDRQAHETATRLLANNFTPEFLSAIVDAALTIQEKS